MTRRLTKAWRAGLIVGLAGGFFFGWRAFARHAISVTSIPARPILSGWPAVLEDNLAQEEKVAGGYFGVKEGLASLSRLYHANGFYNEAMQCYTGLQRIEPGEARWWHLQASILASFGRLDEAAPIEQRAVELAPNYIPARLRLGDILLKNNQNAAAARTYAESLDRDQGNPYALLGLAKCSVAGGDWNKARDNLQQAIKLHPDFIGALSLMATVADHLGDQTAANSLRDEIGRREFSDLPDPWLDNLLDDCYDSYRLSVMAVVANMAGDHPKARQLLERAISLSPNSSSYHRQLGVMLADGMDSVSARQHFEKAVALSPVDVDSWLLLYQLLNKTGDMPAADKVLANGLANCPDSASLHMERARRWNSTGHPNEAMAEFREAYRLNPSEAQPLIELASVLFSVSQGDEALAALHEALRKQPEHPMALATLTFYHISAGDETGALKWWEHVRRQPRTPPQTVESLKQAFQQHFGRSLP